MTPRERFWNHFDRSREGLVDVPRHRPQADDLIDPLPPAEPLPAAAYVSVLLLACYAIALAGVILGK